MENLLENEAFIAGIAVGINICQQKVVMAYDRDDPLVINGITYFVQDGDELLEEVVDEICR